MAYQVLARKWRPKKFADLVGQEHVVGALRNALAQGRLHHAYLLTGTRGVGKTTIARILAKSLNCEHPEHGEPCGECHQCVQIDGGRHVDVVEIDAASNTGIDNIREVLENAQYAPSMGRYKVYIIDEVHMLSKSAFNAMLKTLEEPPEHVKFILATTDPQKVPVTVLSRCLQFVLRNMTPQQVLGHLQYVLGQEQIAFDTVGLGLLARAANGSMRDALSLLDQAIALGSGQVQEATVRQMLGAVDRQFVYNLLSVLAQGNAQSLVAQAQQILAEGAGFAQVLQELALVLQQVAMVQMLPAAANELQDAAVLQQLAQSMSAEQVQLFYQCALHGKSDLPLAPDEQAGVMMTLLRMLALRPLGMGEVSLTQQVHVHEHSVSAPISVAQNTPDANETIDSTPQSKQDESLLQNNKRPVSSDAADAQTQVVSNSIADVKQEQTLESVKASTPVVEAAAYVVEVATQSDTGFDADIPPWEYDVPWEEASAQPPVTATKHPVKKNPEQQGLTPQALDEVETPTAVVSTHSATNQEPLALNADNWPHIVAEIAPQLSAARMIAQHAAFVSFNEQTGELTLEVAHEGKVIEERQYINKMSETLSAYSGKEVNVLVQDWHGGMETPRAQELRHEEERRQHGLQILAQDEVAQQLSNLFEGEWLPESVHLKTSS